MTSTLLGPHALWYLTRMSGVVLLGLLTVTVVVGVLGPMQVRARWWPTFATSSFHRDVSLLAVALLGVHVATTVADGYVPISWRDAVVPFLSPYRPVWLGLGTLGLDLLLALVVTSLLRRRVGLRTWRAVHWAAYASWPVALVHAFGTGSDARSALLQLVAVACTTVVVAAIVTRLLTATVSGRTRTAGVAAVVATPLLLTTWAGSGPLAAGWSTRAGTRTVAASAGVARTAAHPAPARSFRPAAFGFPLTATVTGTLTRASAGPGHPLVDLRGFLSGTAAGTIALRFDGVNGAAALGRAPRVGVYLGPVGDPTRLWGGLVHTAGDTLTLRLWDHARTRYDALLRIAVSADGARWTGSLLVRPHPATATGGR